MNVQYKDGVIPYDTGKKPKKQMFLFTLILNALCRICMRGIEYRIDKVNMEGLKTPYILLSNHTYFSDFYINSLATFPRRVNNVATIDGYYKRPLVMELLGCICKRKFTNDIGLVRSILYSIKKHKSSILCMYPEARYTPIGTTAILPDAMGKLIKLAGVPVVVLISHGSYLRTPFWDHDIARKVPIYVTMTQVITKEDTVEKSVTEINEIIRNAMKYDEYKWQFDNKIKIDQQGRARGLHKVLYQCPNCKSETSMRSGSISIQCEACKKEWELTEFGQLKALNGETEFPHIPDWYEWQRSQVREQLLNGTYSFCDEVEVYSMPHPRSFINLGKATLTHNLETGYTIKGHYNGSDYKINRPAATMYGVHIEYDYVYIKPFDCIDISTKEDSFYCYPSKKNVVTKLSIATEEMYKILRKDE